MQSVHAAIFLWCLEAVFPLLSSSTYVVSVLMGLYIPEECRLRKEIDMREKIELKGLTENTVKSPEFITHNSYIPQSKGTGTRLPRYNEQASITISLHLKIPGNHTLSQAFCCLDFEE